VDEQLNDDHDSFRAIASIAHELRTPLTAIQGAVEILRDEVAGALSPEQREFVNLAHRNLARLRNRIEDALDIAELKEQDTSRTLPLDLGLISESVATRASIETSAQLQIKFKGFTGELALSIRDSTLCRTLASIAATVSRHTPTREVILQATVSDGEVRFEIADSREAGAGGDALAYVVIHEASLAMAREVIEQHRGTLQTAEAGRCGVYVRLPLRSIGNHEGH